MLEGAKGQMVLVYIRRESRASLCPSPPPPPFSRSTRSPADPSDLVRGVDEVGLGHGLEVHLVREVATLDAAHFHIQVPRVFLVYLLNGAGGGVGVVVPARRLAVNVVVHPVLPNHTVTERLVVGHDKLVLARYGRGLGAPLPSCLLKVLGFKGGSGLGSRGEGLGLGLTDGAGAPPARKAVDLAVRRRLDALQDIPLVHVLGEVDELERARVVLVDLATRDPRSGVRPRDLEGLCAHSLPLLLWRRRRRCRLALLGHHDLGHRLLFLALRSLCRSSRSGADEPGVVERVGPEERGFEQPPKRDPP
mmetsp:Transcript_31471/g.91524  ORF Transcript_31471/g.91524 Transcript_31471/m.91524 type:complete len:306 (+) Transcript_31471:197-1114(+)